MEAGVTKRAYRHLDDTPVLLAPCLTASLFWFVLMLFMSSRFKQLFFVYAA